MFVFIPVFKEPFSEITYYSAVAQRVISDRIINTVDLLKSSHEPIKTRFPKRPKMV